MLSFGTVGKLILLINLREDESNTMKGRSQEAKGHKKYERWENVVRKWETLTPLSPLTDK